MTREWPPGLPVRWPPLLVAATALGAVLLWAPEVLEGGPCASLGVLAIAYTGFSILASNLTAAWPRRTRRGLGQESLRTMEVTGRARFYRDIAVRCREAAGRSPRSGDRLRREADYYQRMMFKEMRR